MSDATKVPLSVVMPAYNEQEGIEEAVHDVQHHALDKIRSAELIVVNDGSRDHTGAILDRFAQDDARIRVIHQLNSGHGSALLTGLDAARGEYVFLLDSDQQIPLEVFPALWEEARRRDAVFAVRAVRHDPWGRLVLSAVVRNTLRLLFRVRLRDANVPFKVVRRSVWLAARAFIPRETLAPSLFLAVYVRQRRLDVVEREVPHCARRTGAVSIRRWHLFKFCLRAFCQLLVFRKRLC